MGQPMILDGAQLSSLMETNGFRQVPRTSWGGAYTAVVRNGTQGRDSGVIARQRHSLRSTGDNTSAANQHRIGPGTL